MFRKKLICPGRKMGGGVGVVKIVWDFCIIMYVSYCNLVLLLMACAVILWVKLSLFLE
jgi:hypothetical protein